VPSGEGGSDAVAPAVDGSEGLLDAAIDTQSDVDALPDAAPGPLNLLTGGLLSGNWGNAPGSATISVDGGTICLTSPDKNLEVLGWPLDSGAGPTLMAGDSYTFGFSAWASPPGVALTAQVGQDLPPNNADFKTMVTLTATPENYGGTFVEGASGDQHAGVALIYLPLVVGQSVCFASISLAVAADGGP
jgi:hypothetical protein